MYHLTGLWIRFLWLLFLLVSGICIILFLGKEEIKKPIIRIAIAVVLSLSMIGFSFYMIKCIRNPNICTFNGIFESESRTAAHINPLEWEYCFSCGTKKYYVDMDSLSKRQIFDDELIVGKMYTVSYEVEQNLIVSIIETEVSTQ